MVYIILLISVILFILGIFIAYSNINSDKKWPDYISIFFIIVSLILFGTFISLILGSVDNVVVFKK